ncbi:MAG: peptide-binding protein [Rhodopirellula sp.]|nr:peptide-binding protein [Rhodopirellula sp.]
MPSLFVVRGRDQGRHFQLSQSVLRLGREAGSDIQLFDSEASRMHAEIRVQQDGTWELLDLNSSNGTRVNGNVVSKHVLRSGDRVEIGETLMIFTGAGQPREMDAAHGIDIVLKSQEDGSRIVSSLSRSGADSKLIPGPAGESESDRSLEVMYLTAIAVGRTDDLNELLNRILTLVFDWVEADRGCVMLRDPETRLLQPAARCDRAGLDANDRRISISHTILDFVLDKKEGVRTSNARDDARFDAAASIVQAGVREALCVPLQGRYDIVGAIYVDTYTSPGKLIESGHQLKFTDDHLRLITAIGHQAALAIEDTFYYSALVQSERLAAMGQTIATLSHHVKNILQGIRGGSYLIEAGLKRDDTDAVRKGWGIVDRNQDRISNLVMDMLTFSKEREPELVKADLNETVRDVVELMQTRAAEMNVILGQHLDESIPAAKFDQDGMHRAILNLLTNAIDSTSASVNHDGLGDSISGDSVSGDEESGNVDSALEPYQGKVFVSTSYDPLDGWVVDVVDNGPGVAEVDREKIFSMFESRKGMRGTGLGLPVSAKIMREHGGAIEVRDGEHGSGVCFRLKLPPGSPANSDLSAFDTFV